MGGTPVEDYHNMKKRGEKECGFRLKNSSKAREGRRTQKERERGGTENEAERGSAGVMLFDRGGFRKGSW